MPSLILSTLATTLLFSPTSADTELPLDARAPSEPMLPSSMPTLSDAPERDLACPAGTYPCGADYCTPDGGVCCASVGHPEGYCPGGSVCCADGTCSSTGTCSGDGGSDDGGSDGSCYPDVTCDDGCCPSGSVCGASGSGKCCPDSAPYHCPDEGLCHTEPGQCGGGSSDGGGTTSPGSDPEGWYCSTASDIAGSCSYVRFCLNEADPCQGYYEADGQQFSCSDACDAGSIQSCAQATADYCVNAVPAGGDADGDSDSSDEDSGLCSVVPAGRGPEGWLTLGLLAALGIGARRRALV